MLRFDGIIGTGANQIPPGTTINSAVIRLQIQDGGDTATIHELLAGSADEPTAFDEENTTMLDFGNSFEPRAGVDYNETSLDDVSGTIGPIEIDVTSTLQSLSGGADNLGWIIVPGGGGGVEAVSGEGSSSDAGPPKLTITVSGGTSVNDYSIY